MSQQQYDYTGLELFLENLMFHGTITALITPFKNGTIDEEAYRAHDVKGALPAVTDLNTVLAEKATR